MRKRNEDDKRVLRGRPNNNRNNNKPRIQRRRNQSLPVRQKRKRGKTNKTMLILMIIALVAFVIGAGVGVSLSFEEDSADESPEYENVTVEMTSNLNETEPIYFDEEDDVDYNNITDIVELNLTNQTVNY